MGENSSIEIQTSILLEHGLINGKLKKDLTNRQHESLLIKCCSIEITISQAAVKSIL
jgi:hypothetical protein